MTPRTALALCWWRRWRGPRRRRRQSSPRSAKARWMGSCRHAHASLNIPGFILEASSQQAIPAMFDAAFWVERGAPASYGPDYHEIRSASGTPGRQDS